MFAQGKRQLFSFLNRQMLDNKHGKKVNSNEGVNHTRTSKEQEEEKKFEIIFKFCF